ncbi:MAG TPA: hypothetical protein VKA38_11525 [Draconibacterium sp.]|nr:hypothetical protein [Draconibacterium sp.]
MGFIEEGKKLLEEFKNYAENDHSVNKHSSLALCYSEKVEPQKATGHLKLFSEQSNYFYWIVLFVTIEPLFDHIKKSPEFKETRNKLDRKFREWHSQIET